jgi:hypothetical protein
MPTTRRHLSHPSKQPCPISNPPTTFHERLNITGPIANARFLGPWGANSMAFRSASVCLGRCVVLCRACQVTRIIIITRTYSTVHTCDSLISTNGFVAIGSLSRACLYMQQHKHSLTLRHSTAPFYMLQHCNPTVPSLVGRHP